MVHLFSLFVGVLVLIIPGGVAIRQVQREFNADGRLSVGTVVLVWGVYLFHAGLTGYVAWYGFVPIPMLVVVARLIGSLVLVTGIVLLGAGIREFRSVSRMSGRDEDELVTTGIYRWSRNPQTVGWMLALTGVSILGRSALALVLVGVFARMFQLYLVYVGEPHLARIFGSSFQQYRSQTPRYLAIKGQQRLQGS